jgi:hypothetical protein
MKRIPGALASALRPGVAPKGGRSYCVTFQQSLRAWHATTIPLRACAVALQWLSPFLPQEPGQGSAPEAFALPVRR